MNVGQMPCVLNWFCGIFCWHIVSYKAHRKWVIRVNLPFHSAKITISFFTFTFVSFCALAGCVPRSLDLNRLCLAPQYSPRLERVCVCNCEWYIIYTLIEFTSAENGVNLLIIAFIIACNVEMFSERFFSLKMLPPLLLFSTTICIEYNRIQPKESTSFQHISHVSAEWCKYNWCNLIKPMILLCSQKLYRTVKHFYLLPNLLYWIMMKRVNACIVKSRGNIFISMHVTFVINIWFAFWEEKTIHVFIPFQRIILTNHNLLCWYFNSLEIWNYMYSATSNDNNG